MQPSMNNFATACAEFGLTISTKKTEVMHQSAPGTPYTEPLITVNDAKLQAVDKFVYFGSRRSCMGLNSKSVVLLSSPLCCMPVRPGLCTAGMQSSSMAFIWDASRRLFNIIWQDRVPDTEVLHRAEMESIYPMLKWFQLRWTGHVCRMPDEHLPKRLLYGEVCRGKCSHSSQHKCYKDTLKATLKSWGLDPETWEADTQHCFISRISVKHGVAEFETHHIHGAEQKHQLCKSRISCRPLPSQPSTVTCPYCNRLFCHRIGLISHLHTHMTLGSHLVIFARKGQTYCPSICLSVCPSVCLSACLSASLPVCVCLSTLCSTD